MDWKKLYQEKKATAEKAISSIKSGDRVVLGHCVSEPITLVEELARQKDRLSDVELCQMYAFNTATFNIPDFEKHFKHNSFFASPASRKAISAKKAHFSPVYLSEVPRLFKENILPADVALIQVAPPTEDGYLSYGLSVDYTKAGADSAKIVIAEVNEHMPRTYNSFIHVSEVDYIVEANYPLVELPAAPITDVEEEIGRLIATLVPDKANLQLGIGGIPDAALKFMTDKKDLGIHTEMFSDGVVELYKSGAITNKYNNINPGKFTATFLMGSKLLYDFVHDNKDINMQPVDYTNRITVAGMVDNLISINSAIQIDLFGQICADTIGYRQYSGAGGQVDYVRATSLSPGGKSIIALGSVTRKGISRIVSKLTEGACVTTTRYDVHYIVTEYGITDLRGKTVCERANALINLAHPDFREQLRKDAIEMGIC